MKAFHELVSTYYPPELSAYDTLKISGLLQVRTEKLTDIPEMVAFFVEVPEYDVDLYTHDKSKSDQTSSLAVLKGVLPLPGGYQDF